MVGEQAWLQGCATDRVRNPATCSRADHLASGRWEVSRSGPDRTCPVQPQGTAPGGDPEAALSHARRLEPTPAGSPRFARLSKSPPNSTAVGPMHWPSCTLPAEWAVSLR